jgi:4-amino-4-deoxy-L-arabinose transferase-like glycosyltransferase
LYDDIRAVIARQPLDTVEVLLWSWTAASVGFFTFSDFKLDHYIFPAVPAVCLLCARAQAGNGTMGLGPRRRCQGHKADVYNKPV